MFSTGISNENLWWGPGKKNSLLMSNNAPGFLHYTINTTRPVKTIIGDFEGQFIIGRLKSSGYAPPAALHIAPKPDASRNITDFALTYQPKPLPGLYLGFDHTRVKYTKSVVLERPPAAQYNSNLNIGTDRDKYTSLFARWIMPESRAEAYFQYGFTKYTYELPGKQAEDPAIPGSNYLSAYIAGFSKLISLPRASDEFISIGAEFTEMGNKNLDNLYPVAVWYGNFQVADGYTNNGQILGAAVGPGGNMQTINVDWVKGFKRIGFQVDRLVHNNDMFYTMKPYTADLRRHWVDLNLGANFDWDYKQFVLNAKFVYTNSLNYQWTFDRDPKIYKDFFDWKKYDNKNISIKLGLMYQFR
jgi:hypothetical protein